MRRNKFLDRRVRPALDDPARYEDHPAMSREKPDNGNHYWNVLQEFANCWNSLSEARRKLERSIMYAYEDQWGDKVTDPDTGETITEAELIRRQGKQPLKNNMISPILKNIDGQFRNNVTAPICTVRDQSEAKVGEMMTIAVEYVHDINEIEELDSDTLRLVLCGGFGAQRTEYGWNDARHLTDVWVYPCNPARMFFNTNIEDPRAWDLNCIGEVYDMTLQDVVSHFAHNEEQMLRIKGYYHKLIPDNSWDYNGLQGDESKYMDFYTPARPDMCRVIFGWRKETREAYRFNDLLKGTWGYFGAAEKGLVDAENRRRIEEGLSLGMEREDINLIQYEFAYERYWHYYYLTPWGDVLQEGDSPYWHGEHNYTLVLYPMLKGKVYNFVEDFIDQQRSINRTAMLIDFIRSSSSKGLLIVDENAFKPMTKEEIVDEYVRYNGVLFATLKPGQNINNVIAQFNGNAAIAGDYELLQLQLKLINEISGVNSAMQGKPAGSGTAASLYAQQVENSSLNLKGLFESFNSFRRRRDVKVMNTIQQYYTEAKNLDLAGANYSEEAKFYNPEKVQKAQLDLKLTESMTSAGFKAMINDQLMQLFQMQAIDVKTMLENSTLPYKDKILESIKRQEEQMQGMEQGQPMQQTAMPPASNPMMQQALAS